VQVDAKMDTLIRRHEAGDFVTYNEFGKYIYRNLNGYLIMIACLSLIYSE
jgi:hypothetical protein